MPKKMKNYENLFLRIIELQSKQFCSKTVSSVRSILIFGSDENIQGVSF